jgi:hypothetical protein
MTARLSRAIPPLDGFLSDGVYPHAWVFLFLPKQVEEPIHLGFVLSLRVGIYWNCVHHGRGTGCAPVDAWNVGSPLAPPVPPADLR